MASVILSKAGAIAGNALAGPMGSIIGSRLGSFSANIIENSLVGSSSRKIISNKIEEFNLQTSTYGKTIPIIYGTVRLAGNIIWTSGITEYENKIKSSKRIGGKTGPKIRQTNIQYNYKISLAIAICKGEINKLEKIWVNDQLIDINRFNIRIYKGTEDQLTDPLIESIEKIAPAYRGMAYVVFEEFPLSEFNNNIPNFIFEVSRHVKNSENEYLEEYIEAVNIIPGSGEFVYDTEIQYKQNIDKRGNNIYGSKIPINMHNNLGIANSIYSLNQLKETCPNLKWASPVVTWFTNSLDVKEAEILPAVEFKDNIFTSPDEWKVANFTRKDAYEISKDELARPNYGGTVNDLSVVRYLDLLRKKNVKIMFYPMFFIDIPDKPWRGHLTGESEHVEDFFNKKNGYNEFILHYANLVKGKVDAFLIGSELIGLTKIRMGDTEFPAVRELEKLARKVKSILGNDVLISYAADWSEYHHTEGGWYNLDELWASDCIDFVGIDAYFPLLNKPQLSYDQGEIEKGWFSGEGYEYYYRHLDRKSKESLEPEYAWKNIKYWWENIHINPDGTKTSWQPKSKKIWFTEFGFPSLDGAASQPNVFYDPKARDGGIPRHSKGITDIIAQRTALTASLKAWLKSDMIENKFIWTWDARPYPFWPNLSDTWADSNLWEKGHWLNGKLGMTNIADVVYDLCIQAGLRPNDIDTSGIEGFLHGFIIADNNNARYHLEILQKIAMFDVVNNNAKIYFRSKKHSNIYEVSSDDVVIIDKQVGFSVAYNQATDLPSHIELAFLNCHKNYQLDMVSANLEQTSFTNKVRMSLPVIMGEKQAKILAELTLHNMWNQRNFHEVILPRWHNYLKPGDMIKLNYNDYDYMFRISKIHYQKNGMLVINGFDDDSGEYDLNEYALTDKFVPNNNIEDLPYIGNSKMEIFETSLVTDLKNPTGIYVILFSDYYNWKGGVISQIFNDEIINQQNVPANKIVIGKTDNSFALKPCLPFIRDRRSKILIYIDEEQELSSVSEEDLQNGSNMALIGCEIIQFKNAELKKPGQYMLSDFIRGKVATHQEIYNHKPNERFILLNNNIKFFPIDVNNIGSNYSFVHDNFQSFNSNQEEINYKFKGSAVKPLEAVHFKIADLNEEYLLLNWKSQSNLVCEWKDEVDHPHYETGIKFYLEIFNGDFLCKKIANLTQTEIKLYFKDITNDKKMDNNMIRFQLYQCSEFSGISKPAILEHRIGNL